jgi:uncharacterized coiled-coil protein SlyX
MTVMSEAKQATPHAALIAELLDSNEPKTEREHAAAREIERLKDLLGKANALARIRANRLMSYVCPVCAASMLESDEALLRQALEALESAVSDDQPYIARSKEAIISLRERLKPHYEPQANEGSEP